MGDEAREVTVPCPRCGRPFALLVEPSRGGYAVDVVGWACGCDLSEDEYEDMCDAAVAAHAAGAGHTPTDAPDAPGGAGGLWRWLLRAFGGE